MYQDPASDVYFPSNEAGADQDYTPVPSKQTLVAFKDALTMAMHMVWELWI